MLDELRILGVENNQGLFYAICREEEFHRGEITERRTSSGTATELKRMLLEEMERLAADRRGDGRRLAEPARRKNRARDSWSTGDVGVESSSSRRGGIRGEGSVNEILDLTVQRTDNRVAVVDGLSETAGTRRAEVGELIEAAGRSCWQ